MRVKTSVRCAWEAVRVPRGVGLEVLTACTSAPQAVVVDPLARTMYFFLPAGTAARWGLPVRDFAEPPAVQQWPPGPYWLVPPQPTRARRHARWDELGAALAQTGARG